MKIVCIVGLPGSGKTFLGKTYEKQGYVLLDDYPAGGEEKFTEKLQELIDSDQSCVLTDPHFCFTHIREVADVWFSEFAPHAEIEWIFFENNAEQCRKNVVRRQSEGDNREVEGTIRCYEKTYTVPEGYIPLKVWCPVEEN